MEMPGEGEAMSSEPKCSAYEAEELTRCPICNPDGRNMTGYVMVMPFGSSTVMYWSVRCPKGCDHGYLEEE